MSDKYKNIDDYFKDKFGDFQHEPPEHIWLNVKEALHGKKGGGGLTKGGILGLSIILLVAGFVTLYLLLGNSGDGIITNEMPSAVNSSGTTRGLNEALVAQNNEPNTTSSEQYNQAEVLPEEQEYMPISVEVNKKKKNGDKKSISNSTKDETIARNENIPSEKIGKSNLLAGSPESIPYLPADDPELLAINDVIYIESSGTDEQEGSLIEENPGSESIENNTETSHESQPEISGPGIKSDYGKDNELMFGLYFTPEVIFYPNDDNFTNRSYSIDLHAIYKFSGYFVQSGIGLSFASDQGKYKIDYNKYMGSYEDVYDVTFDSTATGIIPNYHTENVRVYDSLTYIQIEPTKNHFTYLQIPVLFGYGSENRRLGWFVKGGPSLSILVKEEVYNMDGMKEHKILNVESDMPSRIKTNWQFMFSGGITYKIGNRLSLSVEPMVRYYINSTYDRTNSYTKHPYSVGLRSGLLYNF
ncbi:MAG: outer membrane beta-barrel protein [Bacteroidales bacterium]|nr:outer membrane beta-barrel protein [Bacteroidales bacterium]